MRSSPRTRTRAVDVDDEKDPLRTRARETLHEMLQALKAVTKALEACRDVDFGRALRGRAGRRVTEKSEKPHRGDLQGVCRALS